MVDGRGRLRPPFFPDKKSRAGLVDLVRPDQLFRYLVASELRFLRTHNNGNSSQIPADTRTHTRSINQQLLLASERAGVHPVQHIVELCEELGTKFGAVLKSVHMQAKELDFM